MAPASQEPEPASPTTTRPDSESSVESIAQTYKDLIRGEQAAAALEANLTNLENRLDALLAAFEAADGPGKSGDDPANSKDDEPKKDTPSTRDEGSNGQPEESPSSGAAKKP